MGAPAASRQPLSLRGPLLDPSFPYILCRFMSQNLVCKFWKSLFNFSTKGADQCPNCCRTVRVAPAGTHVPPLRRGPISPRRAGGGNPCPAHGAALQLQPGRGCQFLQHHRMLSLLGFYRGIWQDVLFLCLAFLLTHLLRGGNQWERWREPTASTAARQNDFWL